jgi:hypothetical protein
MEERTKYVRNDTSVMTTWLDLGGIATRIWRQ